MNILKTERLILKNISTGDIENVYALTSNEKVAKFMRFNTHTHIKEAKNLIEEYMLEGNYGFTIIKKESEEFVGVCAMKKDSHSEGSYSLSIFSSPKFWNKGYSTEILECIKNYAKESLKAKCLKAYVVSDNIGSLKVLEKNGFYLSEKVIFSDLPQGLLIYALTF